MLENNYEVGTELKVELNDVLYVHQTDAFTGSEAHLFPKPISDKPGWLGVSVIYAQYAGSRPDVLKLKLDMLRDVTGKKVLALPASQIKEISDCFND